MSGTVSDAEDIEQILYRIIKCFCLVRTKVSSYNLFIL